MDAGEAAGLIQRQGSWLSFEDARLGQGRESARLFLKENPKLMQELDARIRGQVSKPPPKLAETKEPKLAETAETKV